MAQSKTLKGLEAGAVVAGAAAAGYYFFGSKNAKKHRATAVKWAGGFKNEVVKEVRMLSRVDKKKVGAVIDSVARAYKSARKADVKELGKAASELKKNWHHLAAEMKGGARKARATVTKSGAQIVKKTKKALKKR